MPGKLELGRLETERQLPALRREPGDRHRARAHAVIYLQDRSFFVHLEEGKTVVLGRSDEADVEVDIPSVSRRHLALRWAGGKLTARDCGSTNGTFLEGRPVEGEIVLDGGQELAMGDAVVVVGLTSPPPGSGRLVNAELFDAQLSQEILRASRLGRPLTLMSIQFDTGSDQYAGGVQDLLRALPDHAAACDSGDGHLSVVVADADAATLESAFKSVAVAHGGRAAEPALGLAEFPRDGENLAALKAAAEQALREPHRRERGGQPPAGGPTPVAVDPVSVRVFALVDRVAAVDETVLLVGETGVGKDVVAREIHRRSRRAENPFVHVNCGAIPTSLFNREMFGHERGAFTGAKEQRIGLFEAASGGTLFLDEITEIPIEDQTGLLRAIEHRVVARVGGTEERPVDIRIVAATNRDLDERVDQGLFREDLFYRLNVFNIFVPALRDRQRDIGPLAHRFFDEITARHGQPQLVLDDDAEAVLERYSWPGNVRELHNVMERAILLAPGDHVNGAALMNVFYGDDLRGVDLDRDVSLKTLVEEVERLAVVRALDACGQNQSVAAEKLGISRRTLIYKMRRFGIPGRGRGVR